MIFNIENMEFEIVDILKFRRPESHDRDFCKGRPFSVLASRVYGTSCLYFENCTLKPDINNYILLPPYIKYSQIYSGDDIIVIHLNFKSPPPPEPELIYSEKLSLKDNFSELYTTWLQKSPGYECRCKALIYKIFYTLYTSGNTDGSVIKNSMDYLYANYKDADFDIDKMISLSHVSPAYFRRIFKNQYKDTVVGFINRLRIEYAKSLIESGRYSITEISGMCGFSDCKYFSTVFKNITGRRPSDY